MKILLTGASGFLGAEILKILVSKHQVSLATRDAVESPCQVSEMFCVGEFSGDTDFSAATEGQACVIHAAGMAHKSGSREGSYSDYATVNVDATLQLAKQAALNGVNRFIFISSIGVNGDSNSQPFKYDDHPSPCGPYAKSKLNAELGLKTIGNESGMDIVIIRPPLIYGPNAPGNFGVLLKMVGSNLPLPFGAIKNSRSFVALDNLTNLIDLCITHPKAKNQTFLVSDDEYISTADFIKKMIVAMGKRSFLVPVPLSILRLVGALVGKTVQIDKLACSLTVDIEHTKSTLNWQPQINSDKAMSCYLK